MIRLLGLTERDSVQSLTDAYDLCSIQFHVELPKCASANTFVTFWDSGTILEHTAYAVKFHYVSGSPGYVGDYYVIQGDALGENPVQMVRQEGSLLRIL